MKRYLIIGNSAAGVAACEAIRKKSAGDKVTIISDEDSPAYCRCLISYYLAGDVKGKDVVYRPESFYKKNAIELVLNKKVVGIECGKGFVRCADKTEYGFDSLLIATGASPRLPKIKGIDKSGVFTFRTMKDAGDIAGFLPAAGSACVLGGGLVGLKAAYALHKRGARVKVIVKSDHVLSQVLDREAAGIIQKRLEDNGIEIIFGHDVAEVAGDERVKAVALDSGKVITSSLLIVCKGVSPNTGLVGGTDIKVKTGIVADSSLCTSVPSVYAAGDVCECYDIARGENAVNALWTVAVEQGKAAGANMCGAGVPYDGSFGMNSLEFFGLQTVSLGVYDVRDDSAFEQVRVRLPKAGIYKKFVLKDNVLVGSVLAGDVKNSGLFLRLIRDRVDVTPFKDRLGAENFSFPEIKDYVKDTERMYV